MTPAELATAFDRLASDHKARDWHLGTVYTAGLTIETAPFDDAEAAWKALVAAAPRAGWLQWQSHQMHFTDGLPEPGAGSGALLAAEAVVSETEGLRLDVLDGRWRLTRYRHDPEGSEYLFDETHHLLHGADSRLCYRRYWRIDAEQGAVQTCAVLVGID